ncbi:MAG TPA: PDZ domain-containing protein [Luteolibacter sp.]|nr:PDZ domain-containing protein [Luteolibacter sp.]
MLTRAVILMLAGVAMVSGVEPVSAPQTPVPVPVPQPPLPVPLALTPTGRAWLGVKVDKVNPTMSAHIPGLPEGVGFIVTSVDTGGPAETVKLQPLDVVWKLGEQLLINEAQLATLLKMQKPGDEVNLSVFRGGQPLVIKLKLGDLPMGRDGFRSELAETSILPSDGSPMRVVTFADRTATYSSDEGKAVLRREGESYVLLITSPANSVIFEGDVSQKSGMEAVPANWQRRVWSLKRGLDHAPQEMVPVRQPRPRVVPPPPEVQQ